MRIPTTARVEISVILAGILLFASATYWLETRSLLPVDIPVTLLRGHIRTSEFKINIHALYSVEIKTDYQLSLGTTNCDINPRLVTRRVLVSANGRVVEWSRVWTVPGRDTITGPFLGVFEGKPGRYRFDVDVLSDTGCIDALNPRLRIEASPRDYADCSNIYNALVGISVYCAGIGVVWILLSRKTCPVELQDTLGLSSFWTWLRPPHGETIGQLGETKGPAETPTASWRHCSYRPGMSPGRGLPIRLPMIGLICVMTYFCLFVTALPLLVAQWERQPMGFRIHLLAHTGEGVNFDPRTEVPVVRIDAHDHVYLNAREVKWAELPEALKAALRQRVDQWVYFEGDPDINFAKAAQAIDIIESEGGKAVLLTPRTKVEAK